MFDLEADRGQLRNIARENPELLDSLKARFFAIAGNHYDPLTKEEELK